MGLFNLSSVKNRPRRSGFDLSSKVAFSAKEDEEDTKTNRNTLAHEYRRKY